MVKEQDWPLPDPEAREVELDAFIGILTILRQLDTRQAKFGAYWRRQFEEAIKKAAYQRGWTEEDLEEVR